MLPADLLEMLRCPQTGQPLALAGPEVLGPLNERLARSRRGPGTEPPLTAALLRLDRLLLYPIRDGIPVLLAEEAIPL